MLRPRKKTNSRPTKTRPIPRTLYNILWHPLSYTLNSLGDAPVAKIVGENGTSERSPPSVCMRRLYHILILKLVMSVLKL